ncbi:MAG: DNA polymerase IV [Algisphaera sp.]
MSRTIFHIDMDAFFASIAVLDDPSLQGKPLLIGNTGPRSVVTTASYEARVFGCRSAMPMSQALRQCPHAIVVNVSGERIGECSQAFFKILDDFSPQVQPLSVDEAFLDMTGTERLLGPPEVVAQRLKDAIFQSLGLVASVGVAPNKFLAKLASDLEKPNGLTVIPPAPQKIDRILLPLPISKIWGIGPATQAKLKIDGIQTIADLRKLSEAQLTERLGNAGRHFFQLCRGHDDRPVVSDATAKSIGQEQTFRENLADPNAVRAVILHQAEQVGYRLRRHNLNAKGLTLKIRFGDFKTITRSTTFGMPTHTTDVLYQGAKTLFNTWAESHFRTVRLIGVSVYPLTKVQEQVSLFLDPEHEKQKKLDSALDQIITRFGKHAVHRGGGRNLPSPKPID